MNRDHGVDEKEDQGKYRPRKETLKTARFTQSPIDRPLMLKIGRLTCQVLCETDNGPKVEDKGNVQPGIPVLPRACGPI